MDTAARTRSGLGLCDAAVLAFAAWTLLCNLVVAAHGTYRQLRSAAAVLLVASVVTAAVAWWRRRSRAPAGSLPWTAWAVDPDVGLEVESPPRTWWALGAGSAVVALLVWMLLWKGLSPGWWLLSSLWFVLALCVNGRPSPPRPVRPAESVWWTGALWGLVLLSVVVTLIAHRPDPDDAFHVNLAVAALDDPDRPLLRTDSLHGVPDTPIRLPLHRLAALPALVALLADVLGLAPLAVAHLLIPSVAALLLPLAYAHLFRLILPSRWLPGVALVVLLLLLDGSTHSWYGNYAFVRLFQGKAVMVSVLLPLVVSYAVRCAAAPRPSPWILLGAALIAAVGLTTSALFVVPLVAGLALLGASSSLGFSRQFTVGLLAAALYLVVVAISFYGEASGAVRAIDHVDARIARGLPGVALGRMLGAGPHLAGCLAIALGAWLWIPVGLVRRLAAVFGAAVFGLLLSPVLAGPWAYFVTGPYTHWRLLWVLPLPVLIAVLCLGPLERAGPRWLRWSASLALCVLFLVLLPVRTTLSKENATRLAWPPGLKVPPAYEVALRVNATAPRGSHVLVPEDVAIWVVTLRDHPFPLVVRGAYLSVFGRRVDVEERQRRYELTQWVATGRTSLVQADIEDGLRRYALAAVCARAAVPFDRSLLARAGFHLDQTSWGYEIWTPAPVASAQTR